MSASAVPPSALTSPVALRPSTPRSSKRKLSRPKHSPPPRRARRSPATLVLSRAGSRTSNPRSAPPRSRPAHADARAGFFVPRSRARGDGHLHQIKKLKPLILKIMKCGPQCLRLMRKMLIKL